MHFTRNKTDLVYVKLYEWFNSGFFYTTSSITNVKQKQEDFIKIQFKT